MPELLLEIGTEEIPRVHAPRSGGDEGSDAEGISNPPPRVCGNQVLGTPRRLVVTAVGVAPAQEQRFLEVMGPAKRIALTKRATHEAPSASPKGRESGRKPPGRQNRKRGIYLRPEGGEGGGNRAASPGHAHPPDFVDPLSKSMRWMDLDNSFVRPIHWILALFDARSFRCRSATSPRGTSRAGIVSWPPGFSRSKTPANTCAG